MQLFNLFIGFAFLVGNHSLHQAAGLIPEIVVAHIHFDFVVVDIDDVGADVVEEMTVVGYDDNGADIVHQKILQPADGCHIQMVGRLVEQDDFRLTEQRLRQQNLDLLLVAHCRHLLIQKVLVQSQTLEQLADFGFYFPAAQFGKFCFQRCCQLAVLLGEIFFVVQRILLLHDFIQARVALDDGVQHRESVISKVVLLEDGHTLPVRDFDRAGGRLQLAGQNL